MFILFLVSGCDFTTGINRDVLKAQDYIEEQKYQVAADLYERILKQNPQHTLKMKIHYQLANLYYLFLYKPEKAIFHYTYIVEKDENLRDKVSALEKLGEIYFSLTKDYSKALKTYQMLLKFNPPLQNIDFYEFREAQSYYEKNELEQAEKLFLKFVQNTNHSHHVESFLSLGLVHFYKQNWDKAVEYFLEYIKREKRKDLIIRAKFLIANSYESADKLKEAYNIYYSLLSDHPNPDLIKGRLKSLYSRRASRKR